jgi:branched-chain amino acid transport system permease protein
METFIQQLINGITLGGLYALIALGYTMVYGVIQLINFAHGEFFAAGGYVGVILLSFLPDWVTWTPTRYSAWRLPLP